MENSAEPSSSLSFNSPPHIANGSASCAVSNSSVQGPGSNLEIVSLSKLSSNLEKLLVDSELSYSDAEIVVEGISVGVHRCILAARSKFFNEMFKKEKEKECVEEGKKPKYCMSEMLAQGSVGYDAFLVFLSYLYTGRLKSFPPEVSTCVDDGCAHQACRPAINFSVELTYASSIFQIPELGSLSQRRLLNFVEKAVAEDVIPILVASFHCKLSQVLTQCVNRVARSNLDTISLEKELPFEVAEEVISLRLKSRAEDGENDLALLKDPLQQKRVRRVHKALDSDDIELVKLLLTESDLTLDEANALHYAAAYCDPKVFSEVLNLGLANVNLRDARGYTVLHVAAMRKEPSIIVSLLNKGACASDATTDGQSAVSICRRSTRPKDYHAKVEHGQKTNKDRICIDVLEREIQRNPMVGDASVSCSAMADDLHMNLLYLENRVALARLLFPSEAKLAMEIANAQSTTEFAGLLASKGSSGNLKEVDLNETPIARNKRLIKRMEVLSKTVETGRRYFPHCSQVLDKLMADDLPDLFYLEKGTQEEQAMKRMRFMELKQEVQRAFTKDKADLHTGLSSSSSSSPIRHGTKYKARKDTKEAFGRGGEEWLKAFLELQELQGDTDKDDEAWRSGRVPLTD